MKKYLGLVMVFGLLFVTSNVFADTIFSDGFESPGNFTGWNQIDSEWKEKGGDTHADSRRAEVKGNTGAGSPDNLRKDVSTSGYQNINLSYWYKIKEALESGDHLLVQWSTDGTVWNTVADYTNIGTTGWLNASHVLSTGANNSSGFRFRFQADMNADNDEFHLDDVSLTGETIPTTGTLIITKELINDNGGINTNNSFFFQIDGDATTQFEADGTNEVVLPAGTYDVSELGSGGYTTSYNNCTDIVLAGGGTATCTITNDDQPAHLTLIKNVSGGTAPATDWTLSATGTGPTPTNISGVTGNVAITNAVVNSGSYDLSESGPSGYSADTWSCVNNGSGPVVNDSVSLSLNDDATCTITNTKLGTISGTKFEDLDGDGERDGDEPGLSGWTINLSGSASEVAVTDADGNYSFTNLSDGDEYTVCEVQQTGWTQTIPNNNDDCDGDAQGGYSLVLSGGTDVTGKDFGNVEKAHIVVRKVTDPENINQEFDFFLLDNNLEEVVPEFSLSGGEAETFAVIEGTYTIRESPVPSGWDLTDITCEYDGDSVGIEAPPNGETVIVDPGDTVTCTFTNTKRGKIIIEKTVVGPDGDFDFTANYDEGGFTLSNDEENESEFLVPGTYSVTEEANEDYTSSATCSDESNPSSINLSAGETVTCTFTNTIKQGGITITKQTFPGDSEDSFEFNPSWTENFSLSDGESDEFTLDPGAYNISEIIPEGWTGSIECIDQDDSVQEASGLTLQADGSIACTFTNTKHGHLIVNKVTNPEGSENSFSITASTEGGQIFGDTSTSISNTSPHDYEVMPGTYSVSEEESEGWILSSNGCAEVAVSAGQTVECTITNTQSGHIIVDKVTNPAESSQSFDFSTTGANYEEFSLTDISESNNQELAPGAYSVSENSQSGWTSDDGVCDNGQTPGNIQLSAGQTVTCIFTNTFVSEPTTGTLTVHKNVVGPDEENIENNHTFTAHLNTGGEGGTNKTFSEDSNGVFENLAPGEYIITENLPIGDPDFDLLRITVGDTIDPTPEDGAPVTIVAGENTSVTITNKQKQHTNTDNDGPRILGSGSIGTGQVLGASTEGQVLGAEKFIFTKNLKQGSKGDEVMELQKFLNAAGYGPLVVDGKFGKKTKLALIKFQLANGLKGDGIVGPLTRAVLNK